MPAEVQLTDWNGRAVKSLGDKGLAIVRHAGSPKHALVLFVHGLRGHAQSTWGSFPRLLFDDPELPHWDIGFFGYETSLFSNVVRLPLVRQQTFERKVRELVDALRDLLGDDSRQQRLCLVAHSLGGLVCVAAIRWLLANCDTPSCKRVLAHISDLVLYGTPLLGSDRVNNLTALLSPDLWELWTLNRTLSEQAAWLRRNTTDETLYLVRGRHRSHIAVSILYSATDNWVDPGSAEGPFGVDATSQYNVSHTQLCKPRERHERPYRVLKRRLVARPKVTPAEAAAGWHTLVEIPGHDWRVIRVSLNMPDEVLKAAERIDVADYFVYVNSYGDYHARYRVAGTRLEPGETREMVFQTTASHPVSWHELSFSAQERITRSNLDVKPTNNDRDLTVKTYRISFVKPVGQHDRFDLQWQFRWPSCVGDASNSDSINLSQFQQGVRHVRYTIVLDHAIEDVRLIDIRRNSYRDSERQPTRVRQSSLGRFANLLGRPVADGITFTASPRTIESMLLMWKRREPRRSG